MSVWESADKTIRKEVVKSGLFCKKPIERSVCKVSISNVQVTGLTLEEFQRNFPSDIISNDSEQIVKIGEADHPLDREIERAIQMMFVKEQSNVLLRLTFNNDIVDLKFHIHLLQHSQSKPIWEWSVEEKYDMASTYKESGVRLFKEGRFEDAFHRFGKACKILITLEPIQDLELDPNLEKSIRDLRLILYNNMANCHLQKENFEHVITLCSKVLVRDDNNVKALYRRGVAYGKSKDVEKAVNDLKRAVALDPKNAAAKEQFNIYNEKWKIANKRSDEMMKRMFKVVSD